ncbi:barH-like 1 homeobox protein [Platysternon megacephalum]|uniref:Major vault protein n=1 Tax=Platysternon megacephalum TaxID=55544 RepID=A0A4D9DKJ6_9SAUR|nr:barH-like 1 homeobox protein [Platysternon megacephalum]
MAEESIIRIPPHHYIHVLDQNSNVTRVEVGPQTYIRQDNERVVFPPAKMVMVPPRHYCAVLNPVVRAPGAGVQFDASGQALLRHADLEIRLSQPPFPLYPGEEIQQGITALQVVLPDTALHLKALLDFEDDQGEKYVAGDEFLFEGPGTYIPRTEVEVVEIIQATVIRHNQAIRLRARKECTDREGTRRVTGEEWLVKRVGAYLPGVFEEVVDIVDAFVLTEKRALHLRATKTFREPQDRVRRTGEEWLVTLAQSEAYIADVYEEVVGIVDITTLSSRQYCVVCDPVGPSGKPQLGQEKVIKVRAVIGHTYMLTEDEELWEKELPPNVEALLSSGRDPVADRSGGPPQGGEGPPRDKMRVVSYRVPHNAAVQVYDYRERQPRVVLGPELVLLGPDEQFTVLSLSGGRPKTPHSRRSLCLLLGPDFCADIVTIETADHARLQLQLAYNWHFEVPSPPDPPALSRLFSVPDFVGDACKALASRIRGAVASVSFDDFHKNSNRILCSAVFGFDAELQVRSSLCFPQNGLVVSSVDVQSVEPVDQRTRDALQRSVQLAIEITTNSQEAAARHEAERLEQEARGRLERQKILDQAEAERARKELLELEALSAAVESAGAARAEAQSKAQAARIAGEAAVEQAKLKAEAAAIETESELARLRQAREQELGFARAQGEQEAARAQLLAEVEVKKFQRVTEAIGPETLRDIALAGPELQVKLLKGLGLQSALITDGSSPINLFSTAGGLLGILPRPPPGPHE